MKRIALLIVLLIAFSIKAQEYQIQIRLVDEGIGSPAGGPGNPVSNDDGLNTIFNNHSATEYHWGWNPVPDWNDRTHFVLCNGCDINQFEQDLISYSSVIEHTVQNEPGLVANALYVQLLDENNGNPTGETTAEGVIITTNNDLNALFIDYNVLYFEPEFPGASNPDLLRVYLMGCDCLASDFQVELDALTDVIEYTSQLGYPILNNPSYNTLDFTYYPNPVDNRINITTTETIREYQIFNMVGVTIATVKNDEELNSQIPLLAAGIYILRVETIDDKIESFRLLKK